MKHPDWQTIGATPTSTEDDLVECPVCADLHGVTGCPDCDDTGLVSPQRADVLEMILECEETPRVG